MNDKDLKLLETRILPRVIRPGRYAGGERNAVVKDFAHCDVRMALAFPDAYEVGMSNLGFLIIYHLVNSLGWALCERVFAPWPDMEGLLRESNLPLFSLESRTALNEFDILGFTLSYELGYTNILTILKLGGIPWRAEDRGENAPLVLGGGCCAFNPEPVAEFFDLFALGEGEELVPELLSGYRELKKSGATRREMIMDLGRIDGVYAPSLYKPEYRDGVFAGMEFAPGAPAEVGKRFVENLDACFYPEAPILPSVEAVHDRANLEIFRGCTRGCRFCHAGMVYRPMRERSPGRAVELFGKLYEGTGSEEISLLSLNTTDYSGLDEALVHFDEFAAARRLSVSIPSSRIDTFRSEVGRKFRCVRPTGLTFAPEAGTQRLRDVINKQLSEEEIFDSLKIAYESGWKKVKLYFMLGLPTETDADVEGIADLVARMVKFARGVKGKGGKGGRDEFTVSVSNFVPKAHTPFQWDGMEHADSLREKQRMLRRIMDTRRVKLDMHNVELSALEGVFSRGDRRLADVLEAAWNLGCRFDGWTEHFSFERWREAFGRVGIEPLEYAGRRFEKDGPLPWSHLSAGVAADFLWREREKSLKGITTEWCGTGERCSGCGLDCVVKDNK